MSDGQRLIIGKFSVYNIISTIHSGFCGAVNIGKHSIWIMPPPVIKLFGWHCFPYKHNFLQISRTHFFQSVCVCDDTQSGRYPVNIIDLLFFQIRKQLHREREKHLGDDFHSCPGFQYRVNIFDGRIKVERRLIADDFFFCNGKSFCIPFCQVHNSLMADDNAFGHSSGTGGEQRIERVCVNGFPPYFRQCFLIHVSFRNFFQHQCFSCVTQCCRLFFALFINKKYHRLQCFKYGKNPFFGHGHINGGVKIPAVNTAQKCRDHIRGFVCHNCHRRVFHTVGQ